MMRPDAALARPARTALSVVNASSGRSLSLTFCKTPEQRLRLLGVPRRHKTPHMTVLLIFCRRQGSLALLST